MLRRSRVTDHSAAAPSKIIKLKTKGKGNGKLYFLNMEMRRLYTALAPSHTPPNFLEKFGTKREEDYSPKRGVPLPGWHGVSFW